MRWIEAFARTTLPDFLAPVASVLAALLALVVAGLVLAALVRFALRRVERRLLASPLVARDERGEHAKRVSTLVGLTRTVALALVWAVVLVMALSQVGLDITPLLAGAGILGLAVGFGAQNLVRDVISGFFHIMENQIRVGDVAVVNGIGGVVEQITYRVIVLRDLAQVVHVVPHGQVTTLANHTKDLGAMVLDVGVAYKEDPDAVTAALQDVAQTMMDDPDWQPKLLEPLEVLGLDAFADSAVVYRVRYKTRPIEQWGVKREFQRRLKREFDRRGIEFPFPHRTLYVAEGSAPVAVRLLADEPPAAG